MDLSNIDLSSLPSLWETRQEEERKQRQQSSAADEFNNSPIVRASAAQESQRQREAIRLQEDEAAGRVGRMPRTNEEAGALIAGDQAALARDIATARQRGLPEDAIADATAAAETFKSRVQRDQGAPQQRAADPMTMWRQVEGHDIYVKASAKERAATRKDFFRRYVAPTVPTDQLVKVRDEFMARTEEPGYGEVLKDGIDQLSVSARALKFTLDPKSQDESVAAELSRRLSQPARKSIGERRIEGAAQRVNEAEGFGDTTSAIGGLLWEAITNPGGVSKMVVRNLPNAAPSLATTAVGAGAGAAAGSVVPVIGTAAGGVGGAIAGGFTGSALTEMGAYVEGALGEELQKRGLQPTTENVSSVLKDQEFRDRISGEAQRKGVTIGAIDAITFGAAGKVGTAPLRNAVTKTLRSEGVDVGNRAAVRAALQDPAIATKVSEAVKAVPGWKQAAAAGGAGLVETGGEGLGEYAGTYAATGEAKLGDAIVESISSLGQSAGQAAISTSLQRSAQGLRAAAQALRNNDPVAAEDALGDVVPPTAPPPLLGYTEQREKVAPEDMEILDGKALPAPPAPPAPPPPPLQIEGTPKQTEIRADAQGNAVQLTPEQQMEADQKRAAQAEQQRAAEAEAAAINASESEKAAARVRATTEERQADAAAAQAVAPEITAAGEGMGEMQPVTGRNQGAGGQQTMNIGEPEGKVAKPRAPKKPAAVKPQQEGLGLQTEDDIQTARDMERMDAEGGRGKASESRSYTNAKGLPAVDITAYHWSKAPRRTLSTGFYGTGLKGSAREEIINDPTVNKRLSFYVDKGTGVRPEAGVGGIAHKADLTNIYDGNTDPLKLRSGDARAFERKVQELGYNGYLDRMEGTQPGQVILLGNQSVDATVLGPRSQIEDGDRIEPLPQPAAKWETVNTMLPSQEAAEKIIAERRKQGKWAGYDMRVAPDGKLFKIETRKASQSKGATIRPVDPQKKAEIQKAVDAFNAKYKGTKYLQVKLLESVDDPQNDGLVQSRTTEGVYYGRTGEVALLVEALPDAGRAWEVLSHEIIGHHGVESLVAQSAKNKDIQTEWNRLMDDVRRAMPEEIKESVRRGYTEAEAAREALARIAERGEKPGFVDRAIVILRKLARALGLKLRNNRADLVDLVKRAARHVEKGDNAVGIELADAEVAPKAAPKAAPKRTGIEQALGEEMRRGKPSFSKSSLGFFSALGRAVDDLNVKAMQPQDWITRINAMTKQGAVKADEVEWSGVTDWLALQKGKVTKDAVQEFLRGNGVKVEETVLGGASSRRFATKDEAVQYISDEGNMTPDEVMQEYGYRADEDYIRLAEQIASENGEASAESSKYGNYTLPGGTNYREVLLTLPISAKNAAGMAQADRIREEAAGLAKQAMAAWTERGDQAEFDRLNNRSRDLYRQAGEVEKAAGTETYKYKSQHWDQPNVLAHIRLNDRTDGDGKKVLFVEEIQSDWGQDGRKQGFRNAYKKQSSVEESNALRARMREAAEAEIRRRAPSLTDQELLTLANTLPINDLAEFAGMQSEWADLLRRQMEDRNAEIRGLDQPIPAAPFVTKTEGWLNLALKRVMVMAAEGGYDKVAFVNGAQSSDRYDLSKQIERIDAKRKPNGEYNLDVATKDGRDFSRDVTESQLEDHVGKEMAKKIVDSTRETNKRVRFSGLDLKVGGEGMKTFYDTIVPTAVKKLLPKVGGGPIVAVRIRSTDQRGQGVRQDGAEWVAYDNTANNPEVGRFKTRAEAEDFMGYKPLQQPGFDVTPEMKKQVDRGVPLFSKVAERKTISTRNPTGVRRTEDPVIESLQIDLESMKRGANYERALNLVRQYPNVRSRATAADTIAEALIEHVKSNLLWLYGQVPEAIRNRSKLWYDGAHKIARDFARQYGVSDMQAAGVLAALSPQKDWFMNVSLAERVLSILQRQGKTRWDRRMSETAAVIFADEKYTNTIDKVRGKTLDALTDPVDKAMWIRVYDETFNPRSYKVVTPEGGFSGVRKNDDGSDANVAWGTLHSIASAVAIAQDGSRANISAMLGEKHKVRSFYNNIVAPNDDSGHVTIDTHAVAAGLLRPLAGEDREVKHNFGGGLLGEEGPGGSKIVGTSGTYALYAEAYRRAAAEVGVLPREMQSITWEAVRGLFVDTEKSRLKESVDAVWNRYRRGTITLDAARAEVLQQAGGKINEPEWLSSAQGDGARRDRGDARQLPDVRPGRIAAGADQRGGAGTAAAASGRGRAEVRQRGGRSESRADAAGEVQGAERLAALPGAPQVQGFTGPDPRLVEVAEQYARDKGITLRRQAEYVKVDPERAARIAAAYEAMPHSPTDKKVRAAYEDLIRQTRAQYDALIEAGYEFTFFDAATDPYGGNPWNAMRDLRANKRMAVYGTYDGYGTEGITQGAVADNPMLADTGLRWKDQAGVERPVVANDLFRAVHDAFGHGLEGAGFRADGEENAWQAHVRLFTGPAVGAITSETRGQNSWLNFGPHGEKNRTAKVEDTIFADQKTGLMPEWTWREGRAGDMRGKGSESRTDTPEFKRWFGDSRAVVAVNAETGQPVVSSREPQKLVPQVMYHTTRNDFTEFEIGRITANSGTFGSWDTSRAAVFVTPDLEASQSYGTQGGEFEPGANVMPLYIKAENPLDLTGGLSEEAEQKLLDAGMFRGIVNRLGSWSMFDDEDGRYVVDMIKKAGYDSVIFNDENPDTGDSFEAWALFDPQQIKSVFNRGTWSPRTGKISESKPAAPQYKAPKQSGLIDALFRGVSKATFADTLTSWAYDRVTSLGSFVPEKVKQGLVSDYALPEPYLDAKIEKSAEINKVLRRTRNMLDMLAGLNREESRVAYLWMSEKPDTDTEKELLAKLPPASRDTLDNMKSLIDGLGREAVRVGLLSPDSYERNKMAYLHRSYTAHLAGKEEIGVRMRRNAAIRAENFKGRGLRHDVTDEALTKHTDEVREGDKFVRLEKRLPSGKLHRVVYVPVGEPVPAQYAGWGNDGVWEARFFDKKSKVGMWRDMTKAERERLGEVEEVRYAFAKTVMAGIRDIENMRFLDWVGRTYATEDVDPAKVVKPSESFLQAKTYAKDEWIKVPDTTIPGTKIKKYGNLTGKYIPAVIFSDIKNQMAFPESELGKLFNDLTSAWKVSKTALSPAVHTNNVMSNFIMADIADVRARDLVGALKVLVAWKRGDDKARKLVERFEDSGADYGSFAANEINTAFIEPLLKEIEDQENADLALLKWSQIINLAAHGEIKAAAKAASVKRATQMGAAPFKALIAAYQAEDTVFRLAKFMREVEAGATDQQAGKLAREAFLNYDINAPWVQAARRTVLPFVAFSYRAIPLMIQTAAKKPWKLAKYFTIGSLLNAASYAALGLSGEDEERERKMLPEELQGRLLGVFPRLVRHPWNDQYGSPVFQDVRNWVPAGNMFDVHQSQAATPLPSWLSASGPMSLFMELMLNKSAFTGKEIIKDTDTATEGMLKVTDHLFKFMAPNLPLPGPGTIIPGVDRGQLQTYATQALIDAGSGRTDAFGRDQSLGTAMLSNIGIKARAYPEDALTQRLVLDFKKKKAEIGANINALARERSRNGITEEQFNQRVAREQEKLQKAAEELQKKLR